MGEPPICEACKINPVKSPWSLDVIGRFCKPCLKIRKSLEGPTSALPGTWQKIEVMAERLKYDLPLFHPEDPRLYQEATGELMSLAAIAEDVEDELESERQLRFTQDDLKETLAGAW
jgi:hypothetical protein